MSNKLSSIIKSSILSVAILLTGGAWAADPVAVWDRDFSSANLTQNGWTLVNWNETHAGDWSTVTIDRNNQGLMINSDSGNSGITVLVKYSGLSKSASAHRVIAASRVSSQVTGDRTGITLKSDGKLVGVWNDSDNGTASGSIAVAGVMAFTYGSNGTYLYYGSDTSSISSTAAWGASGLKAGNDSTYSRIDGAAIGGMCDGASRSGYEAAKGMMVSGIAVFNKVLSNAEMTSYQWPSGVQSDVQTITVNADTSVSAIKEQLDSENYKAIAVSAADGVTITVDEAFGCIAAVSSEGSVKLVAAEQPADLSGVNFSGVQGSLVRSWITSNVVGVNFNSTKGSDVSGALVTADSWIHNNNSASGTSTEMFNDGLSTLAWSSSNTYQGSGSTFITGYLDDGANGGNGVTITLSNVPYATYDVIVYCSTDSSGNFLAKTVNGTTYTWDSTAGKVIEGNAAFGSAPPSTPSYGDNALRITNLTGPLTIYGTARNGTQRGGIAAFEIINTTHEATISSAGEYTLAGLFTSVDSSDNYIINVNESATLNLDAATTVGGVTFNVAADKALTLTGSTLTATTINVNGDGMVVASSGTALAGTLKGDGTVAYSAAPSGVTLTDATWTGTVWLKGIEVTNFRTDAYANSTSGAKVKVSGVTGWISTDYASNAELILDDDTYGFAFKATNANSLNANDRCSTWKKLSGSGLLTTGDNNYQTPCVKIYDASGFTGSINANAGNVKLVVVFCADSETFSPSINSRLGTNNGKILVSAGSSGVSVAAGKTWTAPGGIFIDGSLTVNAGATIPAIATGSTGGITAIGGATINGVIDSEISASLEFGLANLSVVDASVTELKIPADTTPSAETFHPFMGSEKLDLTGCTSLMTLKLNLGASSTFDLSKVLLPESCTTVMIDVGSGRDLTGYSVSNLGTVTLGFSVTETKEEYANGTFSVANVPSGATVSVTRGNGTTATATVTDGTARFADHGTVKISGDATDLDWDFTDGVDDAFEQAPSGATKGSDYVDGSYDMTFYVDEDDSTYTGVYLKHHPYVDGAASFIHNNSSAITVAAVGTMPSGSKTIFMNFGSAYPNKYGLLLANTEVANEVLVAYNYGATVTPITTMTVPNATTARHSYIITKEDGESSTTFTVYLDGIKWKTVTTNFKIEFSNANTGIQFGSDFGGNIRTAGYNAVSDDTGILNVLRVYGRVITPAEIATYASTFPYVSPSGSSSRTFAAAENWIDTTESSTVWNNSSEDDSGTPTEGASVTVTASADTTITVNLESLTEYESLTINGSSVKFTPASASSGAIKVTGMTVVGTAVTNVYGAVDMAGGPMTLTEDGDITFDCSAYDISDIYTTTDIELTGAVDESSTRVHLIAPSAEYRTVSLVYTSGHYAMRITPDHEAGSDVYYTGGYWGTTESTFAVKNSSGNATIVFPGDTVVIPADITGGNASSAYFGATLPANVSAIRVEKDYTFESGVDNTAILGGATVTVAEGCTLSFATSWHNLTLGAVTFNGDGDVVIPSVNRGASITGAVSGSATLTVSGTVTVPSTGSIANTVVGNGRIVFEGALPSGSALLTSLQDSSNWTGTVELKNYAQTTEIDAHKIINLGNYGNSSSTVALNGVTSTMYTGNNTYPDVTLGAIEIGEGGWSDNDGLSYTISPLYKANLTGHGTITVKTGNAGTVRFVGDNHTFNGSVAFGANTGKQVAFMKTDSDTLPSVTAKAIVVAGRTNMSIASGKTWTAGAIKLDGSLTVLTDEAATATSSVAPTAYLDGASLTTTVDGEAGTTTYVTDEVTQISDNQASLGAVTVSEPKLMTGSGGAYMSSLTINDGMTLTYDPVITPLRVETAPVFNGTGKLKLAPRYAGVTCGKFHLVSYPSSASVLGTLANVIDSSSFAADVSYTVTEETVGSYKQLVLKVGDYDNKAKPVSIAQFGDSITEGIWRDGYRGTPNYRIPLMQLLEAYGYKPEARGYRKVGSTDANGVPADSAYEYHTGISAQRIYTGLTDGSLRAGFMESIEAHLEQVGVTDIITLKIGTNDSLGGEEPDNMFEGWTNLVWKIVRMRPTSKIVVCAPVKIMKSGKETSESNAASLRTKIADYVDLTYEQGGFPNGQVTMINGFNIVTGDANYYLTDNIHPNWNGHLQLANGWFPAVTNAIESMTARATVGYPAQTVASAADVAELAAYRAGYVKLATFTNVWTKLSTWSESPYYYVNEAFTNTPMSRVAYFVARKTTTSPDTRYVWVDMDADATTGTKLVDFGVPTSASVNGVVTNLHIYSNSSAIENVAPTVSGVTGTLMLTEKGVNKADGISTKLAPTGPYGFDWNDSIYAEGAWGVMNVARIFDGATPNNHRKLLAAQMLFDFNGFNGARQNALGLGNFAVHGPYNTPNGSVSHFNLNWTFTTDTDEMPTMDARALESGVIEIWGFVAMPNEGGTDAGYIDGTTAVITNTTSSVTVPAGATAVAVSFSTRDAITLTSESLDLATSGVTVYATDAYGAKTATDITAAFKVTAGANNTYTVELDDTKTVNGVKVKPEVDTEAETAPMAFDSTAAVFTVKTIPGLWYVVASGATLESLTNGTPEQADDSSRTLAAPDFEGTVQYYKVKVGPSKASVQ